MSIQKDCVTDYILKFASQTGYLLSKYKTSAKVRGCFWYGHENYKFFVLTKGKMVEK